MEWFNNQLNITTFISIVGLLISLFTLAQSILAKRKRLRIRVLSMDKFKDTMFVTIAIENLSQLPIAVTNIAYISKSHKSYCTPIPTFILENTRKRGDTILENKTYYSSRIPVAIPSLGAFSGVVLFEHLPELPENPPTALTFEVSTNRGKAFQRTVELPKDVPSQRSSY